MPSIKVICGSIAYTYTCLISTGPSGYYHYLSKPPQIVWNMGRILRYSFIFLLHLNYWFTWDELVPRWAKNKTRLFNLIVKVEKVKTHWLHIGHCSEHFGVSVSVADISAYRSLQRARRHIGLSSGHLAGLCNEHVDLSVSAASKEKYECKMAHY